MESEILASPIPWRHLWWYFSRLLFTDNRNQSARVVRTHVSVGSARVVRTRVSVGPSSCCVPNMHAKDERPDVLVDAGAAGLGACVVLRRRLG